jgi:NAD(P)-dependent dehydrogenase (short-subunit alcohol dehydrogenase family)
MVNLKGKVAMITGASRGIGRAVAHAYVDAGAAVVITARTEDALNRVRAELLEKNGAVLARAADVSQKDQIVELVDAAIAEFGRIDALVNNAGTLGPTPRPPLIEFDEHAFNEVLRINVTGPFLMTRAVLPHMLERGAGSIINVTSGASYGYAEWGAYGISKAALEAMTRTWADELDGTGIRVNMVNPGHVLTEMLREAYPGEDLSEAAQPEDITPVFVWLASDASKGTNGEHFEAEEFEIPAV